MAMIDKIYIQAWHIRPLSHLVDGRNQSENMLESMLPYDPTLSHEEYFIFVSTIETIILSTTIVHASTYQKDCREELWSSYIVPRCLAVGRIVGIFLLAIAL